MFGVKLNGLFLLLWKCHLTQQKHCGKLLYLKFSLLTETFVRTVRPSALQWRWGKRLVDAGDAGSLLPEPESHLRCMPRRNAPSSISLPRLREPVIWFIPKATSLNSVLILNDRFWCYPPSCVLLLQTISSSQIFILKFCVRFPPSVSCPSPRPNYARRSTDCEVALSRYPLWHTVLFI